MAEAMNDKSETDEKPNTQTSISHTDFVLRKEAIDFLSKHGYEVKHEIGQGSYGKVYLAFNEQMKNQVAIKVMDIEKFSGVFLNKFLVREVDVMKRINPHHHIIRFYKFIQEKTLFYIVMEYASNGDLFEFIMKRRFIPEYQASEWFKQIIDGVKHIHNSGFAHRDLKCENLLLDHSYNIKITDFGFCCHIDIKKKRSRSTSPTPLCHAKSSLPTSQSLEDLSHTFCGSYVYASPELLSGQPYIPQMADIWSCGVVLYVMLFGSYPYDGSDLTQFLDDENYSLEIPEQPKVSDECIQLIKKIFVNERKRASIDNIKNCEWFKMDWPQLKERKTPEKLKEYFENLGIVRQETQTFDFLERSSAENMMETKASEV